MKRFQIMLPEPLHENLKVIAQKKDIAVSEIIRRSIEEWLKNYNDKKIKDE